ncbi:2-dehydro-3-deoxy-6-phosphogalactonate aldolase [Lacimicrobium alkaliphilum]|uniref:2-dehydro-3-deoxy-6-phosphogalactonate aldolase n=1 Tax=Lacimicrobium alkaliphilum TaxID=1526571 RepID=A0A0U3A7X8_9ALTE|nr:2-dehydro-3-deoxy-6-phosphogalactonate aldolase [Lacimicrobium alkaliphilum]ALS97118.1 2-dehydro-3-deoxy-6-phosphogalactonate aldolase [Lacimicrobium alkaliphilum]
MHYQQRNRLPLVAILRGITPSRCVDVTECLLDLGFEMIEVPMNSPQPLDSIAMISEQFGERGVFGAGTVLSTEQVTQVRDAGGKLIVSPNTDADVIRMTKDYDMLSMPGCITPTEAFTAIKAGADGLKLFPTEQLPPAAVKALKTVIPKHIPLLAVGGINTGNMAAYLEAGCKGFGLGGALFTPDMSLSDVRKQASELIKCFAQLTQEKELS